MAIVVARCLDGTTKSLSYMSGHLFKNVLSSVSAFGGTLLTTWQHTSGHTLVTVWTCLCECLATYQKLFGHIFMNVWPHVDECQDMWS